MTDLYLVIMDTVITMVMSIPLIIFFMYAVILSETHKRFCIRVNQRIAHDCQLMSAWSSQDLNQNLYRIQTLSVHSSQSNYYPRGKFSSNVL